MFQKRLSVFLRNAYLSRISRYILILLVGLSIIVGSSLLIFRATRFSGALAIIFMLIGSLAYTSMIAIVYFKRWKEESKKAVREKHSGKLALLTIVAFVGLGLTSLILCPPGSIPDEDFHYRNSYWYSSILLGDSIDSETTTFRSCDENLRNVKLNPKNFAPSSGIGIGIDRKGLDYVRNHLFDTEDTSSVVEVPGGNGPLSAGGGTIQVRIGTTLGITLGRILSLNSFLTFYLGRLLNLLLTAFLLFLAIRTMPYGSKILAALALLPMTTNLAASYSYDGVIIGLSFYLISLLLRSINRKTQISALELFEISLVTFLLAPLKIIYVLLILLAFFIPASRFSSKRRSVIFKLSLILIASIGIVIWQIPNIVNLATASLHTNASNANAVGISGETFSSGESPSTSASLYQLLAHPGSIVKLLYRTIREQGNFYVDSAIGASLGWFQASLIAPWYVTPCYCILLYMASQRFSKHSMQIPHKMKLLFFGLFLLILLALLFVFTLASLSTADENLLVITGIQGRYLIPFLPLLLLSLRVNRFYYKKNWSYFLPVTMFLIGFLYFSEVYMTATLV